MVHCKTPQGERERVTLIAYRAEPSSASSFRENGCTSGGWPFAIDLAEVMIVFLFNHRAHAARWFAFLKHPTGRPASAEPFLRKWSCLMQMVSKAEKAAMELKRED